MASADPSSLLALGFCLIVLAVAAGALLSRLSRSQSDRPVNTQIGDTYPRMERGVPMPERRAGEGPLWAEGQPGALDRELDEDVAPPAAELPYDRQRYLLTQAEREFFAVLREAAPEGWHVFPQVRLANLVKLRKGTRNWRPHYSRVAQKCVDFVLCDGLEISPRLVVELDDSSHDRADRQARDAFVDAALGAAGLPVLHVRWRRHYDREQLAREIASAAGIAVVASPQARAAVSTGRSNERHAAATTPSAWSPQATVPVRGSTLSPAVGEAISSQRWACRSCNAEVSSTARFCTSCGAPLEL